MNIKLSLQLIFVLQIRNFLLIVNTNIQNKYQEQEINIYESILIKFLPSINLESRQIQTKTRCQEKVVVIVWTIALIRLIISSGYDNYYCLQFL
jgi:hypothetical protein